MQEQWVESGDYHMNRPGIVNLYLPFWPQPRQHFDLWHDEFKGFATTANSSTWNSLIERCQLTTFVNGQSQ